MTLAHTTHEPVAAVERMAVTEALGAGATVRYVRGCYEVDLGTPYRGVHDTFVGGRGQSLLDLIVSIRRVLDVRATHDARPAQEAA